MNVQEQIKEWCKDGRFLRYANERMRKEITEVPENHVVTPEYEALDEGFEYDDRYAAPLAAYLTYRLQMAKLQKKGESAQTRYLVGIRAGHDAGPLRACLFR